MRFGVRRPSLRGRSSARTSWKRGVRHGLGIKAPRGYGFLTNPKKALYNQIYNRTTVSADDLLKSKRSGYSGCGPGQTPEWIEHAVAYAFAAVIMVGFLTWLGLPFMLSALLTTGGLLMAILGEETFKGIAILILLLWFFFFH